MSRRGRGRPMYDANHQSAYPRGKMYADNYSQHDDRAEGSSSGNEYFNNRGRGPRRGGRGKRRPYRGGRGNYQNNGGGKNYNRNNGGGSPITRTILQDSEGDDNMGEEPLETKQRFNPYQRPGKSNRGRHNKGNYDARDRIHGNRYQQDRPKQEYKPKKTWSLIKIFNGSQFDEQWLMEQLRSKAMTAFTPVDYYKDFENSFFYMDDMPNAIAIRDCNKKIESPDGEPIAINLVTDVRYFPISANDMEQIKTVLGNRYNSSSNHLDLSNIFNDPGFEGHKLRLNNGRDLQIVVNMISQSLPQLHSLDISENRIVRLGTLQHLVQSTHNLKALNLGKNNLEGMDRLKPIDRWDLDTLVLDKNPLCESFHNNEDYISAVREIFPNIMNLDGQQLTAPAKFAVESSSKLPPAKSRHVPPEINNLLQQFITQYFELFDKDRTQLSAAYDTNCMFSLLVDAHARGPPFQRYLSNSRNLLRLKGKKEKKTLLQHAQSNVCETLVKLPSTEHDIGGMHVDVPFHSSQLIKFVVRGMFRELPEVHKKRPGQAYQPTLRHFTRTFLCITDGSRLTIINDELYIRNTRTDEYKSAFKTPPPSQPAATVNQTVPVADQDTQKQMIEQFMRDSNMNAEYSKQCLEVSGWNYQQAGAKFLELNKEGKIPPEAFIR